MRPRSSMYNSGSRRKGKVTVCWSTWERGRREGPCWARQENCAGLTLPRSLAHHDCPALQQPHSHGSQQHRYLLGPGHTPPAPVIISHVDTMGRKDLGARGQRRRV